MAQVKTIVKAEDRPAVDEVVKILSNFTETEKKDFRAFLLGVQFGRAVKPGQPSA